LREPIMAAGPELPRKRKYLQQGVVLFRDTCTKEWAINKTEHADSPRNAGLSGKSKPPRRVSVVFQDICSSGMGDEPGRNPPTRRQNWTHAIVAKP